MAYSSLLAHYRNEKIKKINYVYNLSVCFFFFFRESAIRFSYLLLAIQYYVVSGNDSDIIFPFKVSISRLVGVARTLAAASRTVHVCVGREGKFTSGD